MHETIHMNYTDEIITTTKGNAEIPALTVIISIILFINNLLIILFILVR